MRAKIKLIGICVRHKCTKPLHNAATRPPKQFNTKIVRVKRKESIPEKQPAVTSKFVSLNREISPDKSDATGSHDESVADFVSGDAGMRRLHRSELPKVPEVEYDFIHKRVKTMKIKSATTADGNKIKVESAATVEGLNHYEREKVENDFFCEREKPEICNFEDGAKDKTESTKEKVVTTADGNKVKITSAATAKDLNRNEREKVENNIFCETEKPEICNFEDGAKDKTESTKEKVVTTVDGSKVKVESASTAKGLNRNEREKAANDIFCDNEKPEICHFEDGAREKIEGTEEKDVSTETIEEHQEKFAENGETRFNELNMQMLSRRLYEQVFPNGDRRDKLQNDKLKALKKALVDSGMNVDEVNCLPDVNIELPAFEGKDVEEHFYNIAKDQTKHYLKMIHDLTKDIPEMPDNWLLQEGWTRYTKDGAERVDYPLEDGMIFDVEVCMKEGPLPTLATAVTRSAWYAWVSRSLVEGISVPVESRSLTTDVLVPIESTTTEHGRRLTEHQKRPKIIVGHNVSYDRRRIKEQYWLNSTGARFLDTMSLHVCVSGLNSYQRAVLNTEKHEGKREPWESVTSLNGLSDVHKLYCGAELDKEPRNVFVEGDLNEIRARFAELVKYCALDVAATQRVLSQLFPLFEERFPHPVTLAGMLELGSAYLPVNSNWQRYIEESDAAFEDLNYEAKTSLARRADEVCRLMHDERYKEDLWMWDQDWSVQPVKPKAALSKAKREEIENAAAREVRETSDFARYLTDGEDEEDEDPLTKEFDYLKKTRHNLPVRWPHMSGYPAWYRKLCLKYSDENWIAGPQNISTAMKIAPKLLSLTWENYPLHYIREHGWGILVPHSDDPEIETSLPLAQLLAQCPLPENAARHCDRELGDTAMSTLRADLESNLTKTEFWRYQKKKPKKGEPETFYKGSGIWCDVDIDGCCWFFKLPHKDGASHNVGNPLARDFLTKFSENVLAGLDASATQVLQIARTVSYWRNNRDRITSQMVVWLGDESLPASTRRAGKRMRYGAIVPQVVVSGTLTRRATEATWMTASNASAERVGSELRAMVQAPPGYNIVGADVDSQELWIASVVGDAYCAGIHGATPFGWMTLIGTKSNGTDMHSVTARAVGISRDHAKVINYARIYGAGQKFAERLLKQFNPSMSEAEATAKSRKMFALTKGKRVFRLKEEFVNADVEDREYTSYDTWRLARAHGKLTDEMFERPRWLGGTESAMFNRLEEIAGEKQPVTPFLRSRLSRALESDGGNDDKYLPTKINWVVQSGAVDFLHLMMVSMRWLMRDNARFCLSFHDEVRYIVPARYKYNAALAMHVTNLLTRAFCSSRLGIRDLPMSVAFFASVEVDTVLRKEAGVDCKTPSNPHGLENGYGIPKGESLDVWTALEKSGGTLGPWHAARAKKSDKTEKMGTEKSC